MNEYYEKHKEEVKERSRRYYQAHKKELGERQKMYVLEHKEEIGIQKRKYYEEHKEEILCKSKEFYLNNREKHIAKTCSYAKEHRKEINDTTRDRKKKNRVEVITHYGGRCACCGEDTYEFLAIDHIEGGGNKHRKEIRRDLASWLRSNGYPEGYRVLCHNCNLSLGFNGYCPHNKESEKWEPK